MNKFFSLFFVIFALLSCKSQVFFISDKFDESADLNVFVGFDETSRLDGYYIIHNQDSSSDSVKTVVEEDLSDNTSDTNLDASSDRDKKRESKIKKVYIDDPVKIEHYNGIVKIFKERIKATIPEKLTKKKIKRDIYLLPSNSDKKNLTEIIIKEYSEGEFNIIKNINTVIYIQAKVYNDKEKMIANFTKNYILSPKIIYPYEKERIRYVADLFISDFVNFADMGLLAKSKDNSKNSGTGKRGKE